MPDDVGPASAPGSPSPAVASVADALAPYCQAMNVPDAPSVLRLPNVMHLATDITGVVGGQGSRGLGDEDLVLADRQRTTLPRRAADRLGGEHRRGAENGAVRG